jgi:lipid-binding SYLF domain-containing protein
MKSVFSILISAILLTAPVTSYALFGDDDPDKERKEIQEARGKALEKLFEEKPSARQEIKESKGYAVFSSFGMNLFLISTERGDGILHINGSGQEVYMKMFSGGGGLGMGVKDFNAIFIFHTVTAMDNFRAGGWDFSGQADAAAQHEDEGAGAEVAATAVAGSTIYQITDTGVALQATLQGTKFWENEDLN